MATEAPRGPVAATPEELPGIRELSEALSKQDEVHYFLADSNGKQLELPRPVFRILVNVARALASGESVSVVHYDQELTTQEAADLLQVSRPYLIRLLEQGSIAFTKVGTHRRIKMRELLQYKKLRDSRRKEALKELVRVSESLRLYDDQREEDGHKDGVD